MSTVTTLQRPAQSAAPGRGISFVANLAGAVEALHKLSGWCRTAWLAWLLSPRAVAQHIELSVRRCRFRWRRA